MGDVLKITLMPYHTRRGKVAPM